MNPIEVVNQQLQAIRNREWMARESREKEVIAKIPRIGQINQELQTVGIQLAKQALSGKSQIRFNGTDQYGQRIAQLKEEIGLLLEKSGYPRDYLNMRYQCEKCKDTGERNGKICSCKEQMLLSIRYSMSGIQDMLSRENFSAFQPMLFRSVRHVNEMVSPREFMVQLAEQMKIYVESFQKDNNINLLFTGPVGTGKTFLCNCIAKGIMDRGFSVLYQSAPKLMTFLGIYHFSPAEEKRRLSGKIAQLYEVDLLIIDDLGTESINSVTISHLFELLNERLQRKKTVIISTNLDILEFKGHYDERIYSRLMGEFQTYDIFGEDLRIKKLAIDRRHYE